MTFVATTLPHAATRPERGNGTVGSSARAQRTRRYRVANPNHIPMGPPANLHVFVNERGQSWDEGDEFVPDAEVAPETLQWLIEQGLIVEQRSESADLRLSHAQEAGDSRVGA
jgi:hypothetical protein